LKDQIAAGALMWVIGSTIFLVPAVIITIQLLSPRLQRRQSKPTARNIGRPRVPQPFDLLKVPFLGWLLRARYGRMSLQAIGMIVAIAVIVHGLFGHPMGSMNLAGIIPWIYARALGVIALIAVGNLFCMACPFTLPRELGRKLGLATRAWPKPLRNKWLAAALMLTFFWAFEVFAFWDTPARTAWLVIAYFVTAFFVDSIFRGASFCKYVCPVGQFNFIGSLLSPLELKSADRNVCSSCKTHDCHAGNEKQRGCELQLFIPKKVGNMDCTLCMDCVKACPHDNIVIIAGAPGRDLLVDPVRSSVGKLSSRIDVAAVAIIIVTAAFASAAVMVGPVASSIERIGTSLSTITGFAMSFVVTLLLPVVLFTAVAAAALISRNRSLTLEPVRNVICRSSFTLLPLAMGMWCAHLSFHLLSGWSALSPALRQAATDLRIVGIAPPDWSFTISLLSPDALLIFQLLLLDAGLLLSLYIAWRIFAQRSNGYSRTILAMLPWATVPIVLYALGVWILLQPMQMRNMVHG
jgi:ferredoxin